MGKKLTKKRGFTPLSNLEPNKYFSAVFHFILYPLNMSPA
jgi:hypothetical protein